MNDTSKRLSPRELASWKEIADYLGVTVRTAQKWELERGLPVHRVPGGRGRVYALPAELDAWKAAGGHHPPRNGIEAPVARFGKYGRALLVLVAVLIVVPAVVYVVVRRSGPPSLWRVELDTLVVSDAVGRELWRKSFGVDLVGEAYDRSHFGWRDLAWCGDLDGDGRTETLFVLDYRDGGAEVGVLLCFSERGVERWRFVPGKPIRTRRDVFSNHFRVRKIRVAQLVSGFPKAVLVVSYNYPDYPTQVAILSPSGVAMREYWHSGFIGGDYECLHVADLNGDGRNEIYLGGVNNAYKQATLVVLDPETMSGASVEENPDFQLEGFAPGIEIGRVLFPRTCLNKRKFEYNGVYDLVVHNSLVSIGVAEEIVPFGASVYYDLGPDLRLRAFRTSDAFRSRHLQQSNAGELDHQWSAQEEAEMHKIRVFRSTDLHANSLSAKKE